MRARADGVVGSYAIPISYPEAKGAPDLSGAEHFELLTVVSEQGTRMGRQSFIQIRIATSAGRITEILVGGRVVPVIEGRLRVP